MDENQAFYVNGHLIFIDKLDDVYTAQTYHLAKVPGEVRVLDRDRNLHALRSRIKRAGWQEEVADQYDLW